MIVLVTWIPCCGSGGGVFVGSTNSAVTIRNTLVALNAKALGGSAGTNIWASYTLGVPYTVEPGIPGGHGSGPDMAGGFISQGFNLIGISDGSTGFTNGFNSDLVGDSTSPADPLLGPLQMNGGFVPTQALFPGSPAIDQGNSFGIHRDQRGEHRPSRYLRGDRGQNGNGSDIGAFEIQKRSVRMNRTK